MDKNVIRENKLYIFYKDCVYSKGCYKYLKIRESKKYGKYSLHKWIDDNDFLYNNKMDIALYKYEK